MIVCKFGGTCSAYQNAITNILTLSKCDDRRIFVFSAIGKENCDDEKLTDLLIEYCENEQPRDVIESKILTKIENLIEMTGTVFDIEKQFLLASNNFLKTGDRQKFISRGEEWTAQIMAQYLGLPFVSSEKFMFLKKGEVDEEKSRRALEKLLKKHKRIVVPGFYGVEQGHVVVFSRGGSDVSGAIIAKLTNSEIYENWTDVEGIFQVNPAVCKSKTISNLSYADLVLISSHDGKVVHPNCAQILDSSATVMHVRSIFNIDTPFTKVSSYLKNSLPYICYKQNANRIEIKICQNFDNYKTIKTNVKNLIKTIEKEYKTL